MINPRALRSPLLFLVLFPAAALGVVRHVAPRQRLPSVLAAPARSTNPAASKMSSAPRGSEPLVRPENLIYQGAFRLPPGPMGSTSFTYGGTALAFNPARNSLFLVGHDWQQQVTEIAIPEIRRGVSLRRLATATVLQPFADATEGKMAQVGPNTVKVGGLLPYRGQLYLTAYLYYDGSGSQALSHFVSVLDLSIHGDARGPYRVGSAMAGFVSGYFGLVPDAWQSALGGPVLNGNCCLGVVSRTSYGPAVFTIDPTQLGTTDPLPANPLVYYPDAHKTLAEWNGTNQYFNGTTEVRGVVFPEGSRSVLFFGRHGFGSFCYGPGTTDQNQAGHPADGGVDKWCYDPTDPGKGGHAYPYHYYVWAYDANELAAVKAGKIQPWEVKPYAVWPFSLPFGDDTHLPGATYDRAAGRIFLSQAYGDGELPLIHVYAVQFP